MNNTTPDVVELLKSLFFIPFYKSGTALQPLLYVGWTINCEMIFYAIFGVVLAVSKKHTTIVASILIAVLVLLGITFKDAGAIADFYGNMIFFEFPLGMVLCHWWFATECGGPTFRLRDAALCMAGLTAWFVLYQLGYWETGVRVLDYGVPSFFFVGACFTFREAKMPWLLVLLGDASYSLYLLHPFPVIASNKVFKLYNGTLLEDWLWSAAVTAACLAASVVMYKGFELPMQRFLRGHLLPPRQKPSLTPPLEHGPIDEMRA